MFLVGTEEGKISKFSTACQQNALETYEGHAMAVYCKECQTWLNGPRQFEDHKIGKKHRKNVQKAKISNQGNSGSVSQSLATSQGLDGTTFPGLAVLVGDVGAQKSYTYSAADRGEMTAESVKAFLQAVLKPNNEDYL